MEKSSQNSQNLLSHAGIPRNLEDGLVINCLKELCVSLNCCLVLCSLQNTQRILWGRFMRVSWERCLGGGKLSLLMGWVNPSSSRSGWSGVINEQWRSALTGFISAPVLSSNTSTLQRVLLGFEFTQQSTTHLCIRCSHISALTQMHSRLLKDTVFSLINSVSHVWVFPKCCVTL